jgi:hypothetical protein
MRTTQAGQTKALLILLTRDWKPEILVAIYSTRSPDWKPEISEAIYSTRPQHK